MKEIADKVESLIIYALQPENMVAMGLVGALIVSMFYGSNELSMSIASGLIGYIGGGQVKRKDDF